MIIYISVVAIHDLLKNFYNVLSSLKGI